LNSPNLPDYESYWLIFTTSGIQSGGRYANFALALEALKSIGLTYEHIRVFIMMLGITLVVAMLRFEPLLNVHAKKPTGIFSHSGILLILDVAVFTFEFFVVRLRAGISIFFFSLSFIKMLQQRHLLVKKSYCSLFIAVGFLISASTHFETFGVLCLFLILPYLWYRIATIWNFRTIACFFIVSLLFWLTFFWLGVSGSTSVRGEHLASELNFYRLLAISILPILLWAPLWVYYRRVLSKSSRSRHYPYIFNVNYLACAMAIAAFYYSGVGSDDGEAVVRISTLSSVGAALCLAGWGVNARNAMSVFLIVSNSLFFINTVFL
jgi:hypothetical protein